MKFHIIKTTISLIYYLLCLPKNACIQNIRVEYTEVLFTYCWYASANSAYINFILNYFFTFATLNNFLFCTLNAIINYHIDCKCRFMKILLKSALETELSNCIVERPLYRPWKRSKLINAQLRSSLNDWTPREQELCSRRPKGRRYIELFENTAITKDV